jgi:hypothetical protein
LRSAACSSALLSHVSISLTGGCPVVRYEIRFGDLDTATPVGVRLDAQGQMTSIL